MFQERLLIPFRGQWTFSADGTQVIGATPTDGVIRACHVINASAVSTHATVYVTFKLINMGTDGTGTTVIASASTSQTGGSAMVANKRFPLTITAANAGVTAAQSLGLIYDESTTDFANTQTITVEAWVSPTTELS